MLGDRMRMASSNKSRTLKQMVIDSGLTTNLKLCLDAADRRSYSGSSGKWHDTSGNDYDFFRGTTVGSEASDPTFNGTPGALSMKEYFSGDGGDWFTYDSSNETWMNNLHKDNARFSMMAAIYIPASGQAALFATTTGVSALVGMYWWFQTDQKLNLIVKNGSANALAILADSALSTGMWHIVGLDVNETATGFFYADGAYKQVSSANTWTAAYSSPSAAAANSTMTIGSMGGTNGIMTSGTRINGAVAWEGTNIGKAGMDSMFGRWRARFNI